MDVVPNSTADRSHSPTNNRSSPNHFYRLSDTLASTVSHGQELKKPISKQDRADCESSNRCDHSESHARGQDQAYGNRTIAYSIYHDECGQWTRYKPCRQCQCSYAGFVAVMMT